MKRTAKKLTALAVTLGMLLTLFGALGIGGTAVSAEVPSYYEYVNMPGFSAWTDDELAELFHNYTAAPYHSTANMPDGVEDVVAFRITSLDSQYKTAKITSSYPRNLSCPTGGSEKTLSSADWAACSLINGKSIVGDKSFSGADGICFWIGKGNGLYTGQLKIQLSLAPCSGPYYGGTDDGLNDLGDAPTGYRYESKTLYSDDDGYFFLDFDKDFRQVDWWGTDDDGINQSVYEIGEVNTPLPDKVRETFNSITLICFGLSVGDTLYIGDMRSYTDTRVFFDSLDEEIAAFDRLDPAAYTESSYAAASDVYLQAYEMFMDNPENYTQYEVDCVTQRLHTAIESLLPMFSARSDIEIAGFDVWTDDDLEAMADGGLCADIAFIDYSITFGESDHTLGVVSTATSGAPYYGWSNFESVIEGENGEEAVKNPFGADLSSADGLSFWIKFPAGYCPTELQFSVGVAGEVEFINPSVEYPQESGGEGYVAGGWSGFVSEDGESDIYDYLDRLDYFALRMPDSAQLQINIADFHAFAWEVNNADFTELNAAVQECRDWLASVSETDYPPMLWESYTELLDTAAIYASTYGITDEDVGEMLSELEKAREALLPISDGATYEQLSALFTAYKTAKSFWYGSFTFASGTKLTRALTAYEAVMNTVLTAEDAQKHTDALNAAVSGLKCFAPKSYNDDIVSPDGYTFYDLDECTARRSAGVGYTLSDDDGYPEGYVWGLKLTALENLSSSEDSSAMAFYPYRNADGTRTLRKGAIVGDVSGLTGFVFYVSVNDLTLAKNAQIGFGVSNKSAAVVFDRKVDGIPIPASGKGWVFIPTYALLPSGGNEAPIDYSDISAYYFTLDGEYKAGFEVNITGLRAYSGTSTLTPETPQIAGVEEGGEYTAGIEPTWSAGYALLDGKPFVFGQSVEVNGSHTLTVLNGGQTSSVTFTVTGGIEQGIKGDLDGDEQITVADALIALRISVKLAECSAELKTLADVDGDGSVSVSDALAILRVAVGLATGF